MPALTLNGVTVPVAIDAWERPEDVVLGEVSRGTSGRAESAVRKRKAPLRGRTAPLGATEAGALRGLVEGLGYSWSFDADLYSAQGLAPASGSYSSVAGKHGNGIQLPAAGLSYPVGAGAAWSVLGWKVTSGLGTWHHFVRLSTGSKYKNGVATAEGGGLNVAGANLILSLYDAAGLSAWHAEGIGGAGYPVGSRVVEGGDVYQVRDFVPPHADPAVEPVWASAPSPGDEVEEDAAGLYGGPFIWVNAADINFDDVVFLPYVTPAAWVPMLYAEASARAWTAQPNLRASGDLVSPVRLVQGRVSGAQPVAHKRAGTFERGGQAVSFELLEKG